MLTFNQMYSEAENQANDSDATSVSVIKRGLNQGMHKFGSILNREWRNHEVTFDIVASQQWYQMPEDCIRVQTITITIGGISYKLDEVVDDDTWGMLNVRSQTSDAPRYFKVKGSDQFGIWPIPSTSHTGAGDLIFEKAMRDMVADDYTTGSIAVTNGSPNVVGSGTTFIAAMVGRKLAVDPTGGTGDGKWYTVASFTDATHITLENDYSGLTVSGANYLIGEVPDIPPEFHEALIDYALYRYYRRRKDLQTAKDLKSAFDEQLLLAEQNYSSSTSSQYLRARQGMGNGMIVYANNPSFNQTRQVT